MINTNKRKLNILLFLAAAVFISIAATKPSGSGLKTTNQNNSDTGHYKNLKILPKNISEDSLDKIMHEFNAALAVRCNFCHVRDNEKDTWNFASDEKGEKEAARYMMTLTAGINAQYFNFEKSTRPDTINVVKCVTCHHGSPHPGEMEKGMEDNHGKPPPPPEGNNGQKPPPPPNQ